MTREEGEELLDQAGLSLFSNNPTKSTIDTRLLSTVLMLARLGLKAEAPTEAELDAMYAAPFLGMAAALTALKETK